MVGGRLDECCPLGLVSLVSVLNMLNRVSDHAFVNDMRAPTSKKPKKGGVYCETCMWSILYKH